MKNTLHLNSGDLAEQAGSTIATTALQAMRALPTQAQRIVVLNDALADMCSTTTNRQRVIEGFSAILIAHLDHAFASPVTRKADPC